MANERRQVITGMAALVAAPGLAMATARRAQAQSQPDINAIVRQFHVNYSNNDVEKNGDLVDESLVVNLNGGTGNRANGAIFRGCAEFFTFNSRGKLVHLETLSNDLALPSQLTS